MFNNHLMKVCLAAVFAIGLAACSSSSDQATAPDPMPTEPTTPAPEPTPVSVALPADLMYLEADDQPMAVADQMIAAGMSYTSGGVVFTCAEGGEDCTLTIDSDGASATGGMVTAALNDGAQMRADAAKSTQMITERDRLIGKDRALEAATNLLATGAAVDGNLDEDEISISRGPGAAASVTVLEGTASAGYAASATPALANGTWAGARLMRPVAGATQHLVVYTDIEPPTRIQFYNWDGDADTPSRYADTVTDALTTPATSTTVITPLDLVDGTTNLLSGGGLDPKFTSPGPASGGNLTQTFPVAAAADSTMFQGNFNGAPGTYTCTAASTGTDCVLTIAPNGTYTETSGTWTFTPELGSTAWQGDQEFMSFGWWLQEPASEDGAYTFRYYADGNAYVAPTAIEPGAATYTGRAAGQYVVQTIGDSGVTGGTTGEFTAAATLTATFSAAANTIAGTISGFTGDDGSAQGWEVTLHQKALGAMANLPNAFPAATQNNPAITVDPFDGATATMGDQTAYGDWTGQYFGGNAPDNVNEYPLGVGGTFQADNDAVSIAGAFGARR